MKKILLLKKFLKWTLGAIVLGGIVLFSLVKLVEWYEWENDGKYKEQVIIKISPNHINCDYVNNKHLVFIHNKSDKIIREIGVSADGYKKGYSNIIGNMWFHSYKILQPQETTAQCIALKEPGWGLHRLNDIRRYVTEKNLEVYITGKKIYFQK